MTPQFAPPVQSADTQPSASPAGGLQFAPPVRDTGLGFDPPVVDTSVLAPQLRQMHQTVDSALNALGQQPDTSVGATLGAAPDVGQRTIGHVDVMANPIGNTLTAFGRQLLDAAIGVGNLTLGMSGGAPIEQASSQQEKNLMLAQRGESPFGLGTSQIETPEEKAAQQTGAAFAASIIAGKPIASILKMIPTASTAATVAKSVVQSAGEGAVFGAVRPKEPGESLLHAVGVDAALFGGFGLASGLFRAATAPLPVVLTDVPVVPKDATARGIYIAERAKGLSEELQASHLAQDIGTTKDVGGVSTYFAGKPNNVGPIQEWLGSPHEVGKNGGIVGDASARIIDNGMRRSDLARQLADEWDQTLVTAREALKPGGYGVGQGAAKLADAHYLGKLLDSVFKPEDLPPIIPDRFKQAFEIIRSKTMQDRTTHIQMGNQPPDWGIDAYLAHIHTGDLALKDAQTGATVGITSANALKDDLTKLYTSDPSLIGRVSVEPKSWSFSGPPQAMGLSRKAFGRLIGVVRDQFSLSSQEAADLIFKGKVARITPGRKFFGNLMERKVNLAGFEQDPFEAFRIYGHSSARKIAFNDFAAKAEAVIGELAKAPGTETSQQVLRDYVDGVLGRPTQLSRQIDESAKALWDNLVTRPVNAVTTRTGIGEVTIEAPNPRSMATWVAGRESFLKFGYNIMSGLVQLGQIPVNALPYQSLRSLGRGFRLLMDTTQREQVQQLLHAGGLDAAMPLASDLAGSFKGIHDISPWHPLYFMNKGDSMGRVISFLAEYQDKLEKGFSAPDAITSASNLAKKLYFDYSAADAPRILRDPILNTTFQMRKFFIKQMEFEKNLVLEAVRGNPLPMVRHVATLGALGGVGAVALLPPVQLVNWAWGAMSDDPELPADKLQRKLADQGALGKFAAYGLPGLAGVDISKSVSAQIPQSPKDLLGPGPGDIYTILKTGAPAILQMIRDRNGYLSDADKSALYRAALPLVLQRIMKGYEVATTGEVRDSKGRLRYQPENVPREALLTGLGFRTIQNSGEAQQFYTGTQIDQAKLALEQKLVTQIYEAGRDGNAAAVKAAFETAAKHSIIITADQIIARYKGRALPRTLQQLMRAPLENKSAILDLAPAGTELRQESTQP